MAHHVAIVGLGGYAHVHAERFKELGAQLYFASRSMPKAEEFAERYGGTPLPGLQGALGRAEVEGIVLCGPHDRHVSDATAVLAAGKSVLLEKPLARTVAEGRELKAAIHPDGPRLMLSENYAFVPHLEALRVRLPVIGKVRKVSVSHLRRYEPSGWRLDRNAMGGGLYIDMGVHYLRMLHLLLGPIAQVRTTLFEHGNPEMEGESEIKTEFRFARGMEGDLHLSWDYTGEPWVDHFDIQGDAGSLQASLLKPEIRLITPNGETREEMPWSDRRGHHALAKAFLECLAGSPPQVDVDAGLQDLDVVERAYASAVDGGSWQGA
jgi:predicted dehydrogenase